VKQAAEREREREREREISKRRMRVRDGDGGGEVTAPPQHLVFAYYITGHGFGHATRALEVRFGAPSPSTLPVSVRCA